MFTPLSSLKNKVKKQNSTVNKQTFYKKLSDLDLHNKIKQLEILNYNNRLEKLRENFRRDLKNYDLLYPIIKLSNPSLQKSNYKEKNIIINEIFEKMKKRKIFIYFLAYYRINDDILKKIIPSFKYDYYNKDNYIYKENDISNKLYFLLKGKVSFRKKEIYNLKDSNSIKEVEKFVLGEDNYFGEVDLIYDKKKQDSAYSITDCHFLVLEKDVFKRFIEEKISKVETDKKIFLTSFFNNYTKMPNIKLERFLTSNVQTLFFRRNEIIYKEGEDNIYLYIMFIGEAILIKNVNEEEFSYLIKYNESIKNLQKKAKHINYPDTINLVQNNKEEEKNIEMVKLDLLLNRTKYNIVGNLVKGSVGGLEITTGIRKLKYSLISNSDFTCVLKVDLRTIDDYLNMLMINLLPIFIKLEKIIHERIKNIKLIDENILPYSCKRLKKKNIKINFEKEEEENDKVYKRHIQKINDNFELNSGGFIKMNDYNLNLHKQRNYFKKMLKTNQKNYYKIENILKSLAKEEKTHLKYTKFKMNNILSTPKKDINALEIIPTNKNKELKRPESCALLHISKRLNPLQVQKVQINDIPDINNKENNLSKNNLFKINKKTLNVIKNKSLKKKILAWNDFKTDDKLDIKRNTISNNYNLISTTENKKENNINDLLYIKKSLCIDDNDYIKKLFICKSPKIERKSKTKNFFSFTRNDIKTINIDDSNNYLKTNKIITLCYNMKKLKKKIKKPKYLVFYDTGKYDIHLISNLT